MPIPLQTPSEILSITEHRPWKLPTRPWIMAQSWNNLLFAHWSVPADLLRQFLPAGLALDTFEGQAWIGVVPFMMTDVRPRWMPPLPGLSAFPELNVRTYVTLDGKPGVWFLSLDAANRVAVEGARTFFHLPYFNADMQIQVENNSVRYTSHRFDRRANVGDFEAVYHPITDVYFATPGTIDHWLTERYCLYAADKRGRLFRCEIHHHPWSLHRAEAEFKRNTVASSRGVDLPDAAPLLHYVERMDMLGWYLERVRG